MNPVILVIKILILCLYVVVSHAEGECVTHTWKGEEKQICIQSIKPGSMSEPNEVCQIIRFTHLENIVQILVNLFSISWRCTYLT